MGDGGGERRVARSTRAEGKRDEICGKVLLHDDMLEVHRDGIVSILVDICYLNI